MLNCGGSDEFVQDHLLGKQLHKLCSSTSCQIKLM